jgi:hypothetical protein
MCTRLAYVILRAALMITVAPRMLRITGLGKSTKDFQPHKRQAKHREPLLGNSTLEIDSQQKDIIHPVSIIKSQFLVKVVSGKL